MSSDNGKTDPSTELGLAPSLLDLCGQKRSNSDELGTGANAGRGTDIRFAASDPLTELVWSPRNGLSLRCADCRVTAQRNYFFCGAGPSTMVPSPVPLNIAPRTCSGEAGTSRMMAREPGSPKDNDQLMHSNKPSAGIDGGGIEGINAAGKSSVQSIDKKDHSVDCEMELFCGLDVEAEEVAESAEDKFQALSDSQELDAAETGLSLVNPAHAVGDTNGLNQCSRANSAAAPGGHLIDESKYGVASAPFMVNEHENKTMADSPIVPSLVRLESMSENDLPTPAEEKVLGPSESPHWEKRCQLEETPLQIAEQSPRSSQIGRAKRKGKEKAFSDDDASTRKSKDEQDDSHESVESCNSASMFSRGKKRCGYGQELVLRGKRIKRHAAELSGSMLNAKQNSSFINWISNMVKGVRKMKEDESDSLALALTYQNHEGESSDQDVVTVSRNHDIESRNIGFQSIFRSMYRPNSKFQEEPALCENYEVEPTRKMIDVNATPISCQSQGHDLPGTEIILKEKHDESTQTKVTSQENKTHSLENRRSSDVAIYKEIENTSRNSSLGKAELKIDSKAPSEMKAAQDFGNLRHLWINRFGSKGCGFMNKSRDINTCRAIEPLPISVKAVFDNDENSQKNDTGDDASVGGSRINFHSDQKLIETEAMASVLARRLDTIKHFRPSELGTASRCKAIPCVFCGKFGHYLQDCPEFSANEFGDLLCDMDSYNVAKEASAFCIRCFQSTHWAATCPVATLKSHHDLNMVRNPNYRCMDKIKSKEDSIAKYAASTSGLKDLKERLDILHYDPFSDLVLDVSKGIFRAVQKLRLSRSDILKWTNSKMSLSYLEGFFLRLRLGKWEAGLGVTGYYIACITGASGSPENPKSLISVTVSGLNCAVESQHISNHDFLEDELKAWWCATAKNGGRVPSEEDLRQKLNERIVLGL